MLLRMLHPTSGRQGFNTITNQTSPPNANIDPKFAAMINRQAQRAIAASSMPPDVLAQYFGGVNYLPKIYSSQQLYGLYQRR